MERRARGGSRKMWDVLTTAMALPDVRKRLLFVLLIFAIYVGMIYIPLPGIDEAALAKQFGGGGMGGGLLDLISAFTGGALKRFSVVALGIMPYINASIVFQLLTFAIPYFERLQKEEGEWGRKKIQQYVRYTTVILAMVQAFGLTSMLRNAQPPVIDPTPLRLFQIVVTMAAGTAFLMWLGEELTEKGIGNGISLIIFCGIMVTMPGQIGQTIQEMKAGSVSGANVALLLVLLVALIAVIIYVQQAQRRVRVQYAKRVVGNKMYQGASTFLPLKVNAAGVIPIIFAISVFLFPTTIVSFVPSESMSWWPWGGSTGWQIFASNIGNFQPGITPIGILAALTYFGLVVLFTYFYTAVTFKPTDVADTLKKNGGFIPGIRPGQKTAEYLDRLMVRITLPGALFLGLIALSPYYMSHVTHVQSFTLVGGTSLLIVVGVAMDTMQQMEAHLLMRHYEGFIK